MLQANMPSFNDKEDSNIPKGLPPVIDAHVHIFPRNIFSAIRKWFDENAWHIRYQMASSQIFDFLLSHGVKHVIALQYAHKPGIARNLNKYMSEKCKEYAPRVTGMATVFPGEKNAEKILQEAFDSGLGGLKLHAHVQCFDMNSKNMNLIYECCRTNKKPIVMHVGREPKSTAYRCDPYRLCNAEKLENILKDFPDIKICVPHLGFDETAAYKELIEKYDNLWLDTTMVITDYFPIEEKLALDHYRSDKIMYGSDFPNIPYAWDRELKELKAADISHEDLKKISYKNAADFFSLKLSMESNLPIEIRPFSPVDKKQVIDLIVAIQRKEFNIPITADDQHDLKGIPEYYQQGNGNFWVALHKNKVIGTVSLLDIGGNLAALRKMFVNRDYRGREMGTAQKLLEVSLNWAITHRIRRIYLGTTPQFLAAHRFYEKNGFKEISKMDLPETFPIMKVDTKFYKYVF